MFQYALKAITNFIKGGLLESGKLFHYITAVP